MRKWVCGSCGYDEDDCRCPVDAQHDETGRLWHGPRSRLPPRYHIVTLSKSQQKRLDALRKDEGQKP